MSKIELAVVIGHGSIGGFHSRQLSPRYNKIGIIDINPKIHTQLIKSYPNSQVVSNITDLDKKNWNWESSVVVIATWGTNHSEIFAKLVKRGVKHIICEKPLTNSVASASKMLKLAKDNGVALGVHHWLRYAGLVSGINKLAKKFKLGPAISGFISGGAQGLVTNGIHFIDVFSEMFGAGPKSVISSAKGDSINPRSSDLLFYGGTVVWYFGKGREVSISFTNHSSVRGSISIFYRDAIATLSHSLDKIKILGRDSSQLAAYPSVTRVGIASEILYEGEIPGVISIEEAYSVLLEEVTSGNIVVFKPELALQAVSSCSGALWASRKDKRVSLPLHPENDAGKMEWPFS